MSYQGEEEAPLVHPEAGVPVAEPVEERPGFLRSWTSGWRLAAALGLGLLLALLLAGGLVLTSSRHNNNQRAGEGHVHCSALCEG